MLFDSRTVYLGASRDKYEQYCKALDSEKIKYKTKRVNHEEKMTAPGRGTVPAWVGISEQIKHYMKSWSERKITTMQWGF